MSCTETSFGEAALSQTSDVQEAKEVSQSKRSGFFFRVQDHLGCLLTDSAVDAAKLRDIAQLHSDLALRRSFL